MAKESSSVTTASSSVTEALSKRASSAGVIAGKKSDPKYQPKSLADIADHLVNFDFRLKGSVCLAPSAKGSAGAAVSSASIKPLSGSNLHKRRKRKAAKQAMQAAKPEQSEGSAGENGESLLIELGGMSINPLNQ
jgi:hypothetical protein